MVEIGETRFFQRRQEWRAWLEENHDTKKEIWLIYYKKHTGKPSIPYDDAVEEALCFGWIDSIVKRLDGERYTQRYSPRKPKSIWSVLNKVRVGKMMEEGKMTPEGLALVEAAKKSGEWDKARVREEVRVPEDLEKALALNPKARENFYGFTPSQRKHYLWWVEEAKREETRERRIREVVRRSAEKIKPGIP